MKQRVLGRYFLSAALIVLLSLGIMVFVLFLTYSNHLSNEKHTELKKTCNSVSQFLRGAQENGMDNSIAAHFFMANISDVMGCDVYITDKTGKITVCYCKQWEQNGSCEHTGTVIATKDLSRIIEGKEKLGTVGIYSTPRYSAALRPYRAQA